MNNDKRYIATLSAEQRKLLLQQLQKKQTGASQAAILPLKRDTNIFPLSFAQQRLWFLDQMEPGSSAYLILRVQRFLGDLHVEALECSLEALVRRHETLRTTFEERAGQPVQIIHAAGPITFPLIDLQGLEQEQRTKEVQRLIREEAQRPCDLARGPLFRPALVRMEKQRHVILLTLHHIITDRWSNEILQRELSILYQAYCVGCASFPDTTHPHRGRGKPGPYQNWLAALTPLSIQYVDYAHWQRQRLQGEILETQLAYWRKQLAGVSPLELPTDHPRPAVQTYRGDTQTLLVPAAMLTQLQALSQQEGVTMFMLLLAAFQVLLLRYTGQSDISIGTPIANRTRAEIAGVVGFFVNTLVIRGDLSGNPSFKQLLRDMREACLQAYAHQDVPFEKVVEELEPVRDLSRPPLFQVMFALQNASREQVEQPAQAGTSQPPLTVEHTGSKFELTLLLAESRQGLHCNLEYNTDLFEADTILRMLNHWQRLLQGLVQTPQVHLSELPLLTEHERQHLLVEWNATQAAYPQQLCLHNMFEQQVARTPDAIAVENGQEQLTYQQLNKQANQLAHHLQHLGVGPDVLVGIGLERSIELMIAILGILKADGAYVPLDMTHPKLRLASIVESAHLSFLVTNSHSRASLPSVEQVVCMDTDRATIACYKSEAPPSSSILPTNLAYVIYTSGSTGQPKGVMIPHQGVVHYVDWSSKHYAVAAGSGSPVQSPLSFDLTVTSLFPSLVVGRRVVLVPDAPGIEALREILSIHNAFSLLKITPAHLNLLVQSLQPEEFASIAQALIIGGEALQPESVKTWHEHSPTTRLINEYGPTETVVGCCTYEITPDEELNGVVPIGRPIPNTQLYLLDAQLCAVPFGVPGELYIGGIGLGRGYLNRPDLTAERFIANPFSQEPGARLYKTGDLARYVRATGMLEYLGRIDNQVKLRGYRIELAEIEAIIRQHSQVADCAVLLQEEGSTTPRLVSYVVAHAGSSLTPETLDKMVRQYLPAYMVPSMVVMLEALPLTVNGKVDRQQLSNLEQAQSNKLMVQSEARGPVEDVLLKIWRELLAASWLGIHDNFFAVGGHSLLATRLIAQIRVLFQIEMPVRAVFDAPTVATLAILVEQALGKNSKHEVPSLVARQRPEMIPLSFAQQRLWFLDQLQPGNVAYLILSTQRFQGPVHMEALTSSLEELVRRHESLRTTFALQSGQPVQIIHQTVSCPLPLIDLRGLEPEQKKAEVRHLRKAEAQQPCDLARGPLLRTHLIRLNRGRGDTLRAPLDPTTPASQAEERTATGRTQGVAPTLVEGGEQRADEEHVLLLTLHHIITDGWSNEVLLNELITLYQAYQAGQPSPLAPLPIQYADYALWQRQLLQGKVLETQLDYWTRQLGGTRPIELPTDHARPSVPSSRGAVHTFALSTELAQGLIALSGQENVTLFMTLLAAFQVLFYRYTGQTDIVVGTDSTNRNHVEIEGIIGFFVNLLALRVDLSGEPSFREVLKRVRTVVLGAYTHCDTPFELLVERLAPDHHLARTPLVQVLFVMQNMPIKVQDLADAVPQMESKAVDQPALHTEGDKETTVKFDIALFMHEQRGQLFGALNYRLDLFQASTIATFVTRFITLLQSSISQPDIPINLLNIISEAESQQHKQEEQKRRRGLRSRNNGWLDLPAIHKPGL